MQVRKKGWLFQVAYMFVPYSRQPQQVDRCTLVWLFVACFVPWLLASAAAWIAFGLILGIGGHIVMWPWRFFVEARYPAYEGPGHQPLWVPGGKVLNRICILAYGKKDIEWLEWMVRVMNGGTRRPTHYDGRLRSPAAFIIVIAFGSLLLYGGLWWGVPAVWHSIAVPAVAGIVHTFTMWVWVPVAIVAALALHYLGNRFRTSEPGTVLISHFKDWKREHCPIYEVV